MPEQDKFYRKGWPGRLVVLFELAIVMVDLNPFISEPIRYAVLFGSEALFHNVWLAALSFGAVTLLLDALGAFATADLLVRKTTAELIRKIRKIITRQGLTKILDTRITFIGQVGITLLVGAPVALVIRQQQAPGLSRRANLRRGLVLTIIGAPAAVLQGAAIVAGVWHPSPLTIALAVLAIGSIIALQRWVRKSLN